MHGLEEASASQIRQPWRVIAIGAVGQRPHVRMGAPAGSGTPRCGEGDYGAPASVDATNLDPHLVLYLQPGSTNFTSGCRVLFEESRILTREISGEPG